VATLAATFALAGCGGKGTSSTTKSTTSAPATTTTHKHTSKPAY
jgi:predicted small lipoprotein YifL